MGISSLRYVVLYNPAAQKSFTESVFTEQISREFQAKRLA